MNHEFKPYPAYKDSGVPWLGEVPEHWEVLPNRALFAEVKDRDHPEEQMLSVTITKGVIRQQALLAGSSKKDSSNLDKSAYKLVRPGDIAYNKMRAWQGAVGVSDYQGIVSPAYVVQRPREGVHSRYVHYLLRTPAFAKEAERWSYGITSDMWSLRPEHFKMIYGCLPPLPEQAAIVRFLDHVDRRIRRYIRAKQKQINLLEEQKQAIIHRAVTRGLDPKVRLKPSGVEWLGDVPEHWEVKRCRYLFREVDKRSADGSEQHLSMSQRLGLVPSHLVENRTLVSESYAGGKLCAAGDLILNRLKAHLGVFALAQHSGVISPDYTVLRPIEPDGAEYFEQVLRSPACRRELRIRTKGIVEGFWRLYTDDFYDIRLPVPPAEERCAIIAYNRSATTGIDRGVAAAKREIALLREYRTRLIADVVAGKLDVREEAARLPDEPEEPELVDEAGREEDDDEVSDDSDIESIAAEAGTPAEGNGRGQ